MSVAAVIVAGGRGRRMGAGINKVFLPLAGREILAHTLSAFERCSDIDSIVVVTGSDDIERVRSIAAREGITKLSEVVVGGAKRSDSVYNGLAAVKCETAAIHDGARCLITPEEISAVIKDAEKYGAAALGVPVKDTLKTTDQSGNISGTIDREKTVLIQTPQVFSADEIRALHEQLRADGAAVTDDCSVFELYGKSVHVTIGSYDNIKLTTPGDIPVGEQILKRRSENSGIKGGHDVRIGFGYDVHKLTEGRRCVICGVDVPHTKGLLGHSDADVAIHALCDALLGAAALGDIGKLFPDTSDEFKDMDSRIILRRTVAHIKAAGYSVGNVDITVAAQKPKLMPYIEQMRLNIASDLEVPVGLVSIKATTTERLGFEGREEGISAYAVALIN